VWTRHCASSRLPSGLAEAHEAGELLREALFVFVGFPDDRRLAVVVSVGVIVFVVIIIVVVVVGVSRRRHVAHCGDEVSVDQPRGKVLGDARGVMAVGCRDIQERMLAREHRSAKRRARAPFLWTTGASERDDLAIDGRGAWW
jgi:hypothetical protein